MGGKDSKSRMAHYLYILGMLLYCNQIHEWMCCEYNTRIIWDLLHSAFIHTVQMFPKWSNMKPQAIISEGTVESKWWMLRNDSSRKSNKCVKHKKNKQTILIWNKKPTRCHVVYVYFYLSVAQHVLGHHVPIFRSWRLSGIFSPVWCSAVTMGSVISIYV